MNDSVLRETEKYDIFCVRNRICQSEIGMLRDPNEDGIKMFT